MRSRSAAALLAGAGAADVASLAGGLDAWEGRLAPGPPETGMAHFAGVERPEELAALAWYLEAGSRAFYAGLAEESPAAPPRIFVRLADAEAAHMETLRALAERLSGMAAGEDFPRAVLARERPDAVMEGGADVAAALAWARGRAVEEVLDYALGLETSSLDLYLRMMAAVPEVPRGVFATLAAEEQRHIELLTRAFEEESAGVSRRKESS